MKFTNLIKNLKKISGKSEISLFTNQIEINPHTWDSEDGPDNFIIEQSQPISNEAIELMDEFVGKNKMIERFSEVMRGSLANFTENKSVSHFLYKELASDSFKIYQAKQDGYPFYEDIEIMQTKSSEIRKSFKRIFFIGIGGSNLAPSLLYDVFKKKNDIEVIFLTGSDPAEYLSYEIQKDDGFVLVSKSFSTVETLQIFENFIGNSYLDRVFAITANPDSAFKLGIPKDNVINFDSSTNGRFSIWSPVGIILPLLGMNFYAFLEGGHSMDAICLNEKNNNPALRLSMQDIFHNNVLDNETSLILNYDYQLRNFYTYAQQIEMESNGKSMNSSGKSVDFQTGPIVWGGYGPRTQHSFFQHIFEGTKDSNNYLICSRGNSEEKALNIHQFEAQIESLTSKGINTSTITMNELDSFSVGALMSLWENKTIFNSFFWDINAFDQPGVELGKINTKKRLGH